MIRSSMIRWQETAQQLLSLTSRTDEENRDAVIEEIDRLLDERDLLQMDIVAPFTAEEEELGRVIVGLEQQVVKGLSTFTKHIRTDITAAQSKKDHMKSYINPYANVARDGTFYDTKR
ncbi:flagellar protein FliT [Sporosarcina thermotolerans]|uniref:Flagellar protein FliT n=1 Tax=Sporosarcina thermotolerans TaxID=633404 RepID=A0AAW9ABJ3_9BACL|nr:flagellar protein FliT [Sporosarcina thermotolerans]MDW0116976.1 flagellar protein FliT [Sporosarcina thermotolerans]WHT47912.1 flagellar protein FliT [Sporosarcina thermotolerans]